MKKAALLLACLALAATADTGPLHWEVAYEVDVHGSTGWLRTAADFDGDGLTDLVVASKKTREFRLLLNQGNGTVSDSTVYTATWELLEDRNSGLVAGDLNGDGRPDVACVGTRVGGITAVGVLINDGAGGFTATWYDARATHLGPAADADGDGDLDLPVGDEDHGTAAVLLNDGAGAFTSGPNVPIDEVDENSNQSRLAPPRLGDFDGDGAAEFVTSSGQGLEVRPGVGDGTFGEPVTLLDGRPDSILVGDFDGDDDLDVLAALLLGAKTPVGPKTGLWLFRGRGDGTFADGERQLAANCHLMDDGRFLVAADLDGDGDLDLVTNHGVLGLVVATNSGTGDFSAASEVIFVDEHPELRDPIPNGACVGEWDGQPGVDILAPCYYGWPRILVRSAAEPPAITVTQATYPHEEGQRTVTIRGSGFHPEATVLPSDHTPGMVVDDVRWLDAGRLEVDLLVPELGLAWHRGGRHDLVVMNPSGAAARAVQAVAVYPKVTRGFYIWKGKLKNRAISEHRGEFRFKASGSFNPDGFDEIFEQAGGEIGISCGHPDGELAAIAMFAPGDPQVKIRRNRVTVRSYDGRFRLVLRRKSKMRQFSLSVKYPRELPTDGTVTLLIRIGDETAATEETWPEVEKKPGLFKRPKALSR